MAREAGRAAKGARNCIHTKDLKSGVEESRPTVKGRLTEAGDTVALPPDPRPGARLRDLAGSKWTNKGHVCSRCWKGSPFCAHSLPCSWQLQDL